MTETPEFSRRVDINTAREEAYEIEATGKEASGAVKKQLWMSATRHGRLQEDAYRMGLLRGWTKIELRNPLNPIGDDEDNWNHGPNFR